MERIVITNERPRYVISVAAEMLGTRPYTLRYYERVGIIKPARSRGNVRLYSESDIALLKRVMTLMSDLGVNLAGVDIILRMSRQIMELQSIRETMQQELEKLRGQE
jgi:MerR family transcriptional regulator/heat shock protein HspR